MPFEIQRTNGDHSPGLPHSGRVRQKKLVKLHPYRDNRIIWPIGPGLHETPRPIWKVNPVIVAENDV